MPAARTQFAASVVTLVVLVSGCSSGSDRRAETTLAPSATKPNIVLVLADDLTTDLIDVMPNAVAMRAKGMTFARSFVTSSLCCPSRASLLTGLFPHNSGVVRNAGKGGGFRAFRDRGHETDTFATSLDAAGYRTALMGKYLNGYEPGRAGASGYVPPGWDEWAVGGEKSYGAFDYVLNENGRNVHHGTAPPDYLTDVLAAKGARFIKGSARAHEPFLLVVAPTAPHAPATPAPRYAKALPGIRAPRGPAFDAASTAPWLADRAPLSAGQINEIDARYRTRARSALGVDDLLRRISDAIEAGGVAGSTYLIFTSDNGYHMGEHRLMPGKMTAFDTDTQVPLIVTGPGVAPGSTIDALTQNIDLRPTFEELAGVAPATARDGRSLAGLLQGETRNQWRNSVLIEHSGPTTSTADPDAQTKESGSPVSYEAIRTATQLYVAYEDGSFEHYDLVADPSQLHNDAASLPANVRARLTAALRGLVSCAGTEQCAKAQRRPT